MANRRPPPSGRRMDFIRNDRGKGFRPGVSPWQGGAPGNDIPNLLPLAGGSTEATLALASNIINLLQPRQNPVPSLLDMPIRRDFGPPMGRYDRGYGPNRMGNQGNFRRTGTYNRSGERINSNRKSFRPNDGQRQQNKSSPKKEADSKNKPKESEQDNEKSENAENPEGKQEEKKDGQKTRYDDITPQLLKCHICNKSMWDGRSFENHLSGRAHAIMMQKTAESYALTADTMRQEFKIREMKRTRKTGHQPIRDFYCAMCDMFAADGSAHRTTVGHRKLKKYLHPTCTACHKEMPTRIELDEHRLTPEHLRMMQDKQDVGGKPKPEVMMISSLQAEQQYLRDDRDRNRNRRDKDKQTDEKEGEENQEGEEKPADGEGEGKEEQVKESIDKEDTILDYKEGDDLTNISNEKYPAYSTERGVGRSFLSEFKCVQCQLCKKLLDSEETAEVHLRTWRHHQLFLRLLTEKSGKEHTDDSDASDDRSDPKLSSSKKYRRRACQNKSPGVIALLNDESLPQNVTGDENDLNRNIMSQSSDDVQFINMTIEEIILDSDSDDDVTTSAPTTSKETRNCKKTSKFSTDRKPLGDLPENTSKHVSQNRIGQNSSNQTHINPLSVAKQKTATTESRETGKRSHNSEESGNWKRRKTSPDPDENEDHAENGDDDVIKQEKVEDDKMEEGNKETPIETEMPKDDELEDWVQSVDEILNDIKAEPSDGEENVAEKEQKEDIEMEKTEKQPEVVDTEDADKKVEDTNTTVANKKPTTRSSPRGRGRGRRRN